MTQVRPSARNIAATAKYIADYVGGLEKMGMNIPPALSESADTIRAILDQRAEAYQEIKGFPLDSPERVKWDDDTVRSLLGTPGRPETSDPVLVRAAKMIEKMPQNTTTGYGVSMYSRDMAVNDVKGARKAEREGSQGRRDRGAYATSNPLMGIVKGPQTEPPARPADPFGRVASMNPAVTAARHHTLVLRKGL